jgi:4-hydroxybenzoyl-CoA reductase beta subunit
MRLPVFNYIEPKNLNESLEHIKTLGRDCAVLAGGTDLLVRIKQRLITPGNILSLKHLKSLRGIRRQEGRITIGSCTSLADICASTDIREQLPALHQAISAVGAVSIQHHTGTIGGNICQDTRCLFYNQSALFRSGKPPCHKAGGQTCYARKDSDRCHATSQSDGATALTALNASVSLQSTRGIRELPLAELFSAIGDHPLTMADDELLTGISIPIPNAGSYSAYQRLAYRSAIDYPIVCAAAVLEGSGTRITGASVCVGAVSRAPLLLPQVADSLIGNHLSDRAVFEKAGLLAMDLASAFAVDNVGSTVEYRTRMIPVVVRRALEAAAEGAQSTSPS